MIKGKPTRKRSLGRPRRRWERNIRVDFKEMGVNTRNWVDSPQDRDYWRTLVNAANNSRIPISLGVIIIIIIIIMPRWSRGQQV